MPQAGMMPRKNTRQKIAPPPRPWGFEGTNELDDGMLDEGLAELEEGVTGTEEDEGTGEGEGDGDGDGDGET